MNPTMIVITQVRTMKGGSRLLGAITDSDPDDGDYLDVEFHTDFQSDGGDFVIEPGTANEEVGAYTSLDMWNDRLLGIVRPDPKAHPDGAIVWAGIDPYEEKLVDGHPDGDMTQLILGAPVRSEVSTYYHPGAYVPGESSPVAWIWATDEDDDDPWVQTAPIGGKPVVGSDIDTMTPVGGGDSSGAVTGSDGRILPPPGQGYEDGAVPTGTVVAEAFGGIGNTIHVNWTTLGNSSVVNYEVHVSTSTGFTPGAGTLYSTHSFAGEPDFLATATIKDFPATHVLDGTASDPPVPGTDYFIVVIPRDGSGSGTPSAEVSATPVETIAPGSITETEIADDSISTPKLQTNSVTTDALAANSVATENLQASSVTATHIASINLSVLQAVIGTLSAITANLGTVTAGDITGVTITGGTFRTAVSGQRVVIDTSNKVVFYNSDGTVSASLWGLPGDALRIESGLTAITGNVAAAGSVKGTSLDVNGLCDILSGSGAPGGAVSAPAGSIYMRTNGSVYVKTSGSGSSGWQTVTTS